MLTHTTENSESFKSSTLNYKTISLPHNGYKSLHSLFDNQIKAKIFTSILTILKINCYATFRLYVKTWFPSL